jgi:hydrogenase maturation factor
MYTVNLDRILARRNLNRNNLKRKITLKYLNKIALKITDWKTCAIHLGLSLQEIADIEDEQRRNAHRRLVSLNIWHTKNGEDATYINLAEALVQLERVDLIEELLDIYLCQSHNTTGRDWAAIYKATQSKLKIFRNGKLIRK